MVYYDESNDNEGENERCFPNCNAQFVEPPYSVTVPDLTESCDAGAPFEERMLNCIEFNGGRLMVSYNGGRHDSYQWLVNIPNQDHLVIETSTPTQIPTATAPHTQTPEPTNTLTSTPSDLLSATPSPTSTSTPSSTPESTPLSTPSFNELFIHMPIIGVPAD